MATYYLVLTSRQVNSDDSFVALNMVGRGFEYLLNHVTFFVCAPGHLHANS